MEILNRIMKRIYINTIQRHLKRQREKKINKFRIIMSSAAVAESAAAQTSMSVDDEVMNMRTEDIKTRNRLLDNDIRVMKSEIMRLQHEAATMKERLQDNLEKIKLNKQLPYLVANIVEVLEMNPEEDADDEVDGAANDESTSCKGKCAVVKTSTRTVW